MTDENEHGARIGSLEREITTLRQLPERVATVSAQVTNLSASMIREVDGLRAQQKAHKEEATKDRDSYQTEVKEAFKEQKEWMVKLWDKVNLISTNATTQNARQNGWRDVLMTLSQIVIGLAVIAEAFKVFIH